MGLAMKHDTAKCNWVQGSMAGMEGMDHSKNGQWVQVSMAGHWKGWITVSQSSYAYFRFSSYG